MPTKITKMTTPQVQEVFNSVRANASDLYRANIPEITENVKEAMNMCRDIGAAFCMYPSLLSEWCDGVWSQIAEAYWGRLENGDPWMVLDGPLLRPGSSIADSFIDLAKPHQYDPAVAETNVYKRENPNVYTVFHHLNLRNFIKQTIYYAEIEANFNTWDQVTDYVNGVIYQMVESVNYCVYQAKKYVLARAILDGEFGSMYIAGNDAANAKAATASIKGALNLMRFPSRNYNNAGVVNSSLPGNTYVIIKAEFDAVMDVEVLAAAFNMERAQFMDSRRLLVDSFGNMDTATLNAMFSGQPGYVEISADEMAELDKICAVALADGKLISRPHVRRHEEKRNEEGEYNNHFEHFWYVMGISPFKNALVFTTDTPAVTALDVSPSNATLSAGSTVQLTASVTTTGFAPKTVTWSSSSEFLTVGPDGIAKALAGATKGETATVTATSKFDSTKTGTATITFA